MQICKLLYRICVAAVKTTSTATAAQGEVFVCVCVYESKGGAAQITSIVVCVYVQKFGNSQQDPDNVYRVRESQLKCHNNLTESLWLFLNNFLFIKNGNFLVLICVFTSRLAMLLPFTAILKILKMGALRVTKYPKIPKRSKKNVRLCIRNGDAW